MNGPLVNIVLIQPEIPQNTGNIARLSLCTRSRLYLVGKLAFSLEEKQVRRAGLDYWDRVDLVVEPDLGAFLDRLEPERTFLFTRHAGRSFHEVGYPPVPFLLFGCETKGLPEVVRARFPNREVAIPQSPAARCLNLSNAVAVAVYQVLGANAGFSSLMQADR
ncbi:MAG: hypothetical protein A2284_15785 [Deltaproteobacteria bacterium RIFOXYA12_FULL_61_11]|nr:MAG: hypothetical protein A2284_15785 [Deltaproteobacteria bacterium RIFOXYA12_FULL_61_11]